ncbi:hypothetical protein JKF63_07175 [Porcisia hertigi]|uniref:Fe2OG dioxygenase domain-containing protein n=1 Tax=Porcisia hertigi TaxID=2761500 RepID=A0A836YIY5_9TRYP|nr:hypothetical protein JKF63_07175 [Porcisia hertigi]
MWSSVAASGGVKKGKATSTTRAAALPPANTADAESTPNQDRGDASSQTAERSGDKVLTTAGSNVSRAENGRWHSSLLRERVAAGAMFHNVALTHAADLLRSEAARVDAQLIDDFSSLLRGNAVYIRNFITAEKDMRLYDTLKKELVAATGAEMVGSGGLIDWSKHQVFDNPADISPTFRDIIAMLDEYFDIDVYATRLNYYRDGTHWKPQHHDSHAYGGRALREDFTVGLSLGATRSLLFVHEASQREFDFPQRNGDCFAFTGEVNQLFTHGVPRAHTPTADRFSIIAWGRRRTLNERNGGGVPSSATTLLGERHIGTMEEAVEVAKQLVASHPGATSANQVVVPPPCSGDEECGGKASAASRPVKRKKNRLQ